MASAAWAEIMKHEETCGLRYEMIANEQKAIRQDFAAGSERQEKALAAAIAAQAAALLEANKLQADRSKAIEDTLSGARKYVLGILGALAVSLVGMYVSNQSARASADESDKRELRARLTLLTSQVNAPRVVVTQAPGQAGPLPTSVGAPPADPGDLTEAAGGDPAQVRAARGVGK